MVNLSNDYLQNYAKKEQARMKRNDCMMAVVQQWELKRLSLQIEDLQDKERQIRKLRLSEAQVDVSVRLITDEIVRPNEHVLCNHVTGYEARFHPVSNSDVVLICVRRISASV